MSGRALCWLAAAVALSVCRGGLGDDATWPGCTESNQRRVVKRGEADREGTYLYLNNCSITSLRTNDLVYPELLFLDLQYNNIKFIETGVFDSLSGMTILFLNNINYLGKDLPSSLFRNCHSLKYIEFSDNDMSDTPADLLQGLNKLKYLSCDNCSLQEFPPFVTRSMLPIVALGLNHNQLTRVDDPATFVNISKLTYLNLKSNKIDYLHDDLLKPLTDIREILLSDNKIRRIPEQLFQNKSHLFEINLSNNLIDYIPEKAFLGTALKYLSINDNRLVYLPENFLSELHNGGVRLRQFYFDGNLWSCGCLNELLVEVKQLNIPYKYENYDGKHKNCIISDSFKCHRPNICQELFMKLISDGK